MEIEIDDFTLQQHIEHYIDRLMERQINHYIQFKLKNAIEERLNALRLDDPALLTDQLSAMVDAKVREILPGLVHAEVKNSLQRIVSNIQ